MSNIKSLSESINHDTVNHNETYHKALLAELGKFYDYEIYTFINGTVAECQNYTDSEIVTYQNIQHAIASFYDMVLETNENDRLEDCETRWNDEDVQTITHLYDIWATLL